MCNFKFDSFGKLQIMHPQTTDGELYLDGSFLNKSILYLPFNVINQICFKFDSNSQYF